MTVPIISTKLHIQQQPRYLVPRPHLIHKLDAGSQGKLILVSAPAGFGKTSLIAEWVEHCMDQYLISWIHLDENDNEVSRFLSYIIAAMQNAQKDFGEATLSGLQSTPPSSIEAVLASLINEINSLEREIILVLDDYHLIDVPEIHNALSFLIEHLPSQMCLVIATRIDPPLSLHKLRARGELMEIRAVDLRFNRVETETLLQKLLKQQLSDTDIDALDNRVEGWVAGLQMVALSMQEREDIHEFVETFSGSHRFIMDYLAEEIFFNQPDYIQEFLLLTSVLDRLCGSLCDTIIGTNLPKQVDQIQISSSQEILEQLEKRNLFLLPLDDEKQWYRYHNLFAHLLRQRLRQTWPEKIPEALIRAALWFDDEDYIDEAFSYALASNDFNFAANLIENRSLDLLKRGALLTLLGGLRKLPEDIILKRPWLNVYFGWSLLLTGELGEIEQYLAAAEDNQHTLEETSDLRGHIAAIRAYASSLAGKVDVAYLQAQEAQNLLPINDLTARSVVSFVLGGINLMRKDIPSAIKSMKEAGKTGKRAGNIHLAVSAMSSAGSLLINQGRLAEAEDIYKRALKLATGKSGRPLPIAANVFSGLVQLYLSSGDLANARHSSELAIELAGQWGNMDSLAGSYLSLAQVCQLEGNSSEAQLALQEAKRIASNHTLTPGFEERIAGFETQAKTQKPGGSFQGLLIEPLTERELEVLGLVTDGRSNPEIASELVIAIGTVKAHTSSIYRKLDVRNRTEAVIKARQLGLL